MGKSKKELELEEKKRKAMQEKQEALRFRVIAWDGGYTVIDCREKMMSDIHPTALSAMDNLEKFKSMFEGKEIGKSGLVYNLFFVLKVDGDENRSLVEVLKEYLGKNIISSNIYV